MLVERAGTGDVGALVELRLDYLREDYGELDAREARAIREALPDYFRAHLERDLFAYVAREGEAVAACALLLILVMRAFAKVPVQSPAGNCDPVSD